MRFQRAHSGISKIYLAELLALIGTVLMLLGLVLGFIGMKTDGQVTADATAGLALSALVTMVPGVLLPLIAAIVSFIGLKQASEDEPTDLRTAFFLSIASLLLPIISGVIQGVVGNANLFSSLISMLGELAGILVTVFTVSGISRLMSRVGRHDLVDRGNKILWLLVAAQLASILVNFLRDKGTFASIVSIAALLFSLVMYIMYLGFLRNARNALA